MLMVFLIVLPAPLTPGVDFDFGSAGLPPGVVGFVMCDAEGARRPLLGTAGVKLPDFDSEADGIFPVLLRVFETGNAGKAVVGGPYDGLEGRGIEACIVKMAMQDRICADEDRTRIYKKRTVVLQWSTKTWVPSPP